MGFEGLRAIVEPIVKDIDGAVAVCITQTSDQRKRHVYEIHLSKWGFTVSPEIPFEEMMEGSVLWPQLPVDLENAIEGIRRQSELEVQGDVDKLFDELVREIADLAKQEGLVALGPHVPPERQLRSWKVLTIRQEPGDAQHSIGVVDVRGFSNQRRVVLTLKRVTEAVQPREEQKALFRDFCEKLERSLIRSGFVQRHRPPKPPLGFETPQGD